MWITCRVCGTSRQAHDRSNSRIMGLCNIHRETERIRLNLPPIRGPVSPSDVYELKRQPKLADLLNINFSETLTAA